MMLDGGLATTLEAHGCDLNDSLWSARTLLDDLDISHITVSVHNSCDLDPVVCLPE